MPQVFICREFPGDGINRLTQQFQVTVNRTKADLTQTELVAQAKDAAALIPMITNIIDAEVMDSLRRLKIIANYGVGYSNIDIAAAKARAIVVTNTPGVLTEATADLTMALLLALVRRVVEGDALVRRGEFQGFYPNFFLSPDLTGKTLGIFGLGQIGMAVARRAVAFDLRVIYHNRHPSAAAALIPAEYVSFEELLSHSDFISVNAPLNEQTFHRFDRRALAMMKPSAFIINTARGPIVSESALIEALQTKRIAGAGLDVYEDEPRVPAELVSLPNVVLLPHLGSATFEVRAKMGAMAAKNVIAFFNGQTPPNLVV
ncbi:MAG: D-glycerate dehydrogenase [Deltaproteobacteria bacterium]|nr:D-glycerate dehydrogenase [Deltaproteobacteria bacterium]